MIMDRDFVKIFEEGETVRHRWNHWDMGVIIGADSDRDQYLVMWSGGPILEHPSFILEKRERDE